MMLETIKRSNSIIDNKTELSEIFSFKNFPIYMGSVEKDSADILTDMKWGYCERSGLIQLMELIPLDLLYSKHHNPGVTGKTWEDHHYKFSELIKSDKFDNVLEIGGASGTLFNHFLNGTNEFKWNVLEPSGSFKISDERICVISDYFENYNCAVGNHDVVVHSHVLEHIYDPINFLTKVWNVLSDGGYQYISIPNMKEWLSKGYTNTLMFEHTYYIDENVLEYLLNKTGFVIEDRVVGEHSIMIKSKKIGLKQHYPDNINFEYSKRMFESYIQNLKSDVSKIINTVGDNNVYLFGAHIFSQIYLNLGLNEENIISILDNNLQKQGKRLYGTNITIRSPEILREEENPIVIVRAGTYTEEIISGIKLINSNTTFY